MYAYNALLATVIASWFSAVSFFFQHFFIIFTFFFPHFNFFTLPYSLGLLWCKYIRVHLMHFMFKIIKLRRRFFTHACFHSYFFYFFIYSCFLLFFFFHNFSFFLCNVSGLVSRWCRSGMYRRSVIRSSHISTSD